MNQEASTSSIPKVQVPTRYRRRLDHSVDLMDGGFPFDMIPRQLSRAVIEGDFPFAKFRLLLCMMSHASGFHVKRAYLEKRFDSKTLQKYVKELVDEGYIEVETVSREGGGVVKLYHVRSIQYWAIYSQSDDTLIQGERQTDDTLLRGAREEGGLKETELKESKTLTYSAGEPVEKAEPEIQEPKAEKPKANPSMPRKGNPLHREAVRDMVEEGKKMGLTVKADLLALTVDNLIEKHGATIPIIREVWPSAVVGILEKGNTRPVAAFRNWVINEMKYREQYRQRDQNRATKGFHRGKSRGTVSQSTSYGTNSGFEFVEPSPEEIEKILKLCEEAEKDEKR